MIDEHTRLAAVIALLLLLALPASAQVIDGDSIKQDGKTYRLWGIDAPELQQECAGGWPAGRLAASRLQSLTAGKQIICQDRDRDRYGRVVAVCTVTGVDLGEWMVRQGYAWAFTRYSRQYEPQEVLARADRLGIHAHDCQPAWEWRQERR